MTAENRTDTWPDESSSLPIARCNGQMYKRRSKGRVSRQAQITEDARCSSIGFVDGCDVVPAAVFASWLEGATIDKGMPWHADSPCENKRQLWSELRPLARPTGQPDLDAYIL